MAQYRPVSEKSMARAYDSIGAQERGRIKEEISRLFSFYSLQGGIETRSWQKSEHACAFSEITSPKRNLNVFVGAGYSAFSRLLAVIIPAVCCGIKKVFVFVGDGEKTDARILATLEISGIEEIYLWQETTGFDPENLYFYLGQNFGCKDISPTGKMTASDYIWVEPQKIKVGVWLESQGSMDTERLFALHPDLDVTVYSPEARNFEPGSNVCTREEFIAKGHDIVFAPEDMLGSCSRAWLRLGPGLENAWHWPNILSYLLQKKFMAFKENSLEY